MQHLGQPGRIRPWRVGLTGGIGSGKSTVAKMLVDQGAGLIDADLAARSVTAAAGAAIEPIRAAFGSAVIDAQGGLDRDAMRALAFSDPGARTRLQELVHPLVGQAMQTQAQALTQAGHAVLVYDIPLLVEGGRWARSLDLVWVVDCTEATQMQRVHERSGLDAPTVQAIMAAQASRAKRRAAADAVIYNEGLDLPALAQVVQALASRLGLVAPAVQATDGPQVRRAL
jgi:dephospho-CoA kinase